jgi:diguanylate cyclase (GGDEF)-like protein
VAALPYSDNMKVLTQSPHVLPENHRVFRVVESMCYLGFPAHTAFIPLFFSLGIPLLAYFNIFSAAAWLFAAWLNRRGRHDAAIALLTFEVVSHAALATYCFGWGSSFQTYLMPMITFTMINNRMRSRTMVVQAAGLTVLYVALYKLTQHTVPQASEQFIEVVHYTNVVIVFAALGIISYYFRQASIEAERRMEELASTDMLTHLTNRRRMREMLEMEFSRFLRTGRQFAIILTDIDFFKKLNDEYGHDCGDFVLRTVAARLRGSLRTHDAVARWGGEEFLVLLPESSFETALETAERMRRAIEVESICFCGHDLSVTMTFGVALTVVGETLDACITRADMALYQGKHQGRNRVSGGTTQSGAAAS